MSKKPFAVAALVLLLTFPAGPAVAADKQQIEYGYFYGTFGEDPNIVLLVGGEAEDFCEANPDDPFNGSPSTVEAVVKERRDGSVSVKANVNDRPIHLYYVGADEDGPVWISRVCNDIEAGADAPEPFASGTALLKVRNVFLFESGPPLSIYNSVNGTAIGTDGTKYHVRAAADLPEFVDGVPVGTPPDWVSFSLK